MTVPGRGGLPPRRVDQVYAPPAPGVPPGTAAGILRAFELILFGTGARGIFVYNGTPALGNPPVITLTPPGVTQDPYKNPVLPGGLSIIFGGQTIFLGSVGGIPELEFLSGQAVEGAPSNIVGHSLNSGLGQFLQALFSGPKLNVAGSNDWVQIELNSGNVGATTFANLELNYIDISNVAHLFASLDANGLALPAASIIAADPTLTPTAAESWKTLTLLNGYTAGANNGFLDNPQIRMQADNKILGFKGTMKAPAAGFAAPFAQVPANYPNANLGGCFGKAVVANLTGSVTDHLQVQNNGNISLENPAASITYDLSCQVFTQ